MLQEKKKVSIQQSNFIPPGTRQEKQNKSRLAGRRKYLKYFSRNKIENRKKINGRVDFLKKNINKTDEP